MAATDAGFRGWIAATSAIPETIPRKGRTSEDTAVQAGMLVCVLADRFDTSLTAIADPAVERAEQLELR
ncbi:hypothetical protein C489_20406 [Natrinema versiforme JCM 10478]|uniref:DUF8113 domain-containing protein n=2 Tax=Natrinema versiforme TaxID=88724 RepID=L9XQM4_9EURY|nr:hypothetical protein C489_20406 [Natrinema versiforme JCM 10478]